MKKHIPNLITLCNLFCGCVAVGMAVTGQFGAAGLFVALGIFFDFFDGFFARLLHVKSEIGLQLDSLADMVTSGVVPGIVMCKMLSMSNAVWIMPSPLNVVVIYLGFLITLGSAYRLAKFNIDSRQTSGFIGLPTPANTLFILSLPLILEYQPIPFLALALTNTWFLLGITLLSTYALNAEIRLFALKFKDYSFANNKVKYVFLGLSALLLIALKLIAIPLIIILYVVLSLLKK